MSRKVLRSYHCVNRLCRHYDQDIDVDFPRTGHAVIVGTVYCDECGWQMRSWPADGSAVEEEK